jgi:hypothetical protein
LSIRRKTKRVGAEQLIASGSIRVERFVLLAEFMPLVLKLPVHAR